MRVSGDTLSHLLLLTSKPGAVLLGRPQFFFVKTAIFIQSLLLTTIFAGADLFAVNDVNSDTDQDQADN